MAKTTKTLLKNQLETLSALTGIELDFVTFPYKDRTRYQLCIKGTHDTLSMGLHLEEFSRMLDAMCVLESRRQRKESQS